MESSKSSRVTRSGKIRLTNYKCTEISSDSVEESSYNITKRLKTKSGHKKCDEDVMVKNSVQKSKRKTQIPVIVTKDEAEKEIGFTREKWLKMDGAALGARCLDHIAEFDRRGLSVEISLGRWQGE